MADDEGELELELLDEFNEGEGEEEAGSEGEGGWAPSATSPAAC
jgi:hypothetical protein